MTSDTPEQRRNAYRALCENETSIPLFSRAFWLDAVCGPTSWDVALAWSGERIDAALPYFEQRYGRRVSIGQPKLTQTAGPWLRPSDARYAKRLAQEKDLLTELIDRLEAQCPFERFSQSFHHSITNWLPFFWRGYSQTTRYTYVLDNLSDLDALWQNTQANIRTDIRKAEGRNGLTVRVVEDTRELSRLTELTFRRQGLPMPYDAAFLNRLDDACRARKCRRIMLAQDAEGHAHAALYLVWDDASAYYLAAGADPELRKSGAQSFLVWEAIRFAATVTRSFDFEGSMIEPVERFVRAFGAKQVPYFSITKTNSLRIELGMFLERFIPRLRAEVRRHLPRR